MRTGISFFVLFRKGAVPDMNEVDEENDDQTNDGETTHNSKGHGPTDQESYDGSTYKHSKKVEHTSYFLSCCLLKSQSICIELLRKLKLIVLVEPTDILPQKTPHVSFSASNSHPLANNSPAGEGNPRSDKCPQPKIEENIAIMDGIVKSGLRVADDQKRVKDFSPKIGKPGETASGSHSEDNGKDQQKIVCALCVTEQFTKGYHLFFLFFLFFLSFLFGFWRLIFERFFPVESFFRTLHFLKL